MATEQKACAMALQEATESYLAAVRECLGILPETVQAYGSPAFQEKVGEIAEWESTCDARLREIRTQCGTVGPNFTDVYLHTDDVLELFALIDAIPNAAEDFATALQAAGPELSVSTREDFEGMAAVATRSTMVLTGAIEEFVDALLATGPPVDPTEAVDLVAELEGRADALKLDVQRRVFSDDASAHALVIRDLARTLDATLDASEDAADHLLFVYSAQR